MNREAVNFDGSSAPELEREICTLRARLAEAEEELSAIRAGEVDALLVQAGHEHVVTLEDADKPYRLVVAQVPQAAVTLTAEGSIIAWNGRFAAMVGQAAESMQGRALRDVVLHDSRRALERLLEDGRTKGDSEGWVMLAAPDGSSVSHFLHVQALREGALGLCLVVTDLTDQRRYEELQRAQLALQKSEEALREADRRKDEFLATLAHELRNPLAPMRNAVEFLRAKGTPVPELRWAHDVLDRQVQLMARLLDDLLDVSRVALDKPELRREVVELGTIVDAAVETALPLIERARLELSVALPPEPIHVDADPVRLAQVFGNLLNNAAKFTNPGGRISLTTERGDGDVTVTVSDTGIGIEPDLLPHVFEIFSQAKPSDGRAQGGLGIGLSLVKGLVEMHGGSVEASSEGPGKGASFCVRLPVVQGSSIAQNGAARRSDGARADVRRRVVIVDDHRDSADSMAMLLSTLGHEVACVYDGISALETAESMRPDVILLDIGMPKIDGYEVCRRLREQPWGADVYVVALTGWGQDEDRERSRKAGFDSHLVKPVDFMALKSLIESDGAPNSARPLQSRDPLRGPLVRRSRTMMSGDSTS